MSYEILKPISHGKEGRRFELKPGDAVANDFFKPEAVKTHLTNGNIQPSKKRTKRIPGKETFRIRDITVMTIPAVKEVLEAEFKVANLERYEDQERTQESPRMDVLRYIDRRIKELTGYEGKFIK